MRITLPLGLRPESGKARAIHDAVPAFVARNSAAALPSQGSSGGNPFLIPSGGRQPENPNSVLIPATVEETPAAVASRPSQLLLPDGTRHDLSTTVLLGRDPAHSQAWPEGELLPVHDSTKTVSKTHAVVEVADGKLWVRDLKSTNGVFVFQQPGNGRPVLPGERVEVSVGDRVSLGEFVIEIV